MAKKSITTVLTNLDLDGIGKSQEYLSVEEYHNSQGWGQVTPEDITAIDDGCKGISRASWEPMMVYPTMTRYSVNVLYKAYNNYMESRQSNESTIN